jgi:Protein of unknown function (DUF4238)
MTTAKNQHWLSQFYLRQFAVPGFRNRKRAKIWSWTKADSEPRKRKISDVCAEEYLYSHLRPDGGRCFRAERKLASLETTISRFYSRMSEGFPDLERAGGMKKLFSLFLATLLLRHPSEREGTRNTHRAMVAWYETLPRDASGRPIIPDAEYDGRRHTFDNSRWEEYRDEDENGITRMFAEGIEANARALASELLKKRWAFLCLNDPLLFTSDSPLVIKHLELPTSGLGTPGVHVFFPLTPKRMLHMTDRQNNSDGFYPFPSVKACNLNFFTFGNSKQMILSHDQPDSMLETLDTYMNELLASAYRQHSAGISSPV